MHTSRCVRSRITSPRRTAGAAPRASSVTCCCARRAAMPTCCARSAAASIVERAVIHAAAPPELHLPDLPEVEVSLGATPPVKPRAGLRMRLRELLGAYLPLLLMAL